MGKLKVNRVERHIIKKSHKMYPVISEYCRRSKNLYNFANYIVRQSFIKNGEYIPYLSLTKMIKHEEPFKSIGSNSGQHTLRILEQNWKSYFAAIKDYNKHPNKYLGKPRIPKYLDKDSKFVWVLTNLQSKIIDHSLVFSFKPIKEFNGLFKTKVKGKLMQTRFIPKNNVFIMEIVYQEEIPITRNDSKRIIGIDLGVDNFTTVVNNFGEKPFSINGKGIKSINNYYNKLISRCRSELNYPTDTHWTKRMADITHKRNNKIDYFMHSASKYIVDYCVAMKVDVVVLGHNKKWKQQVYLGRNTQSFVYIPYQSFISKLEYKLQNNGIRLISTEEAYTSKASFLDKDLLKGGESFSGKRKYRGLYITKDGIKINADVNAAYNIILKVFPNAFEKGIKGVGLHPVIINVVTNV